MNRTDKPSRPDQVLTEATPNRDRRREPSVIDAKAVDMTGPDAAKPDGAAAAGSEPVGTIEPVASIGPEPETIPPVSARAESPPPSRASKLPLLAAILGGAGLALGGAALIHWYSDGDSAVAALSGQARTLEERIAALDARTAGLATSAALNALDARLKTVEQRPVPAAPPAVAAPIPVPTAAPAGDALADLERRVTAAETAARTAQSEASAAMAAAATAVAEKATAQPRPADAVPVAPPIAVVPPVDLGPVQDRIGKLETRLATLESGLASPKVETRATETRVEPTLSTAGVAALGVVAQSLVRALDRGAPFAQELAALKSLGLEQAVLAPLDGVARTGAETPAALMAAFTPLTAEIAADRDGRNDVGVLDRLSRSASSLVRIRPVGEVAGDAPADIAARIEAALRRGDLAGAQAAWGSLPEGAKKLSAKWAAQLDARVKADLAAFAIQSDAIARLARSKN